VKGGLEIVSFESNNNNNNNNDNNSNNLSSFNIDFILK